MIDYTLKIIIRLIMLPIRMAMDLIALIPLIFMYIFMAIVSQIFLGQRFYPIMKKSLTKNETKN